MFAPSKIAEIKMAISDASFHNTLVSVYCHAENGK